MATSSLWKMRGMMYMAASAVLYATASFFVAKVKTEANSFQAVFVSSRAIYNQEVLVLLTSDFGLTIMLRYQASANIFRVSHLCGFFICDLRVTILSRTTTHRCVVQFSGSVPSSGRGTSSSQRMVLYGVQLSFDRGSTCEEQSG